MHANDLTVQSVYIVQIVVNYSLSSLHCTCINGSSTKRQICLNKIQFCSRYCQVCPRSFSKFSKITRYIYIYTVYLCVKQAMFFNVKNLRLAPQYRKWLLQISASSVRNIHTKVEETSATCNNKSDGRLTWLVGNLHVSWGLKHGTGGWLLVIRTIFLSCKINWYFIVIYILRLFCFLKIFPHIFQTQ